MTSVIAFLPLLALAASAAPGPRCAAEPKFDFQGAYFRKVEAAAAGSWVGFEGVVRLPAVALDPSRYFVPKDPAPEWQLGPLDRPSVYVGAHDDQSGGEVDAGLTWDRVYDVAGRPVFTDLAAPGAPSGNDANDPAHRFVHLVSDPTVWRDGSNRALTDDEKKALLPRLVPDFAFRVFWRTPSVVWDNPKPGSPRNVYFYPGQTVAVKITQSQPDAFRLELAAKPDRTFSGTFPAAGFPLLRARFKRVDSIDQFMVTSKGERKGNERSPAITTQSSALDAAWLQARLLSGGPLGAEPDPLQGKACVDVFPADLKDRWKGIYALEPLPDGGERLSIRP